MTRIERPDAPAVLSTTGTERRAQHCAAFDANPDSYRSGESRFRFHASVYSHKDVKDALIGAQKGKCCYCESRIGSGFGAVEHFRPKRAISEGGQRQYPGYYWLAYQWENLLFACDRCNNAKSDLFPLKDSANRATSHHDDCSVEEPMLIDPAADDPSHHIGFLGDAIVSKTERGRETIEILKLDSRADLREGRLKVYQQLQGLLELKSALESGDPSDPNLIKVESMIARATDDREPFQTMLDSLMND